MSSLSGSVPLITSHDFFFFLKVGELLMSRSWCSVTSESSFRINVTKLSKLLSVLGIRFTNGK